MVSGLKLKNLLLFELQMMSQMMMMMTNQFEVNNDNYNFVSNDSESHDEVEENPFEHVFDEELEVIPETSSNPNDISKMKNSQVLCDENMNKIVEQAMQEKW